jgi:hypothetical protein
MRGLACAAVVGVLFCCSAARGQADAEARPVEVVRFPGAAAQWGAAAGADGRLHVASASAKGNELRYLVSSPDRTRWAAPVPVPTGDEPVTIAGIERGPRIAANGGSVAIAWQCKDHIVCRYSPDEGKSWQPVRVRDESATGGVDMVAMAAGPKGHVAIIWNDSRGHGKYSDNFSTALYMAESKDGGRTFGPNVWLNEGRPGACPCCLPWACYDEAGHLWVAHRSSDRDVKEITVLCVGSAGAITHKTISHDGWHMVGCPMNGPEIAASGDGLRLAAIWNRERTILASASVDGGNTWTEPRAVGTGVHHAATRVGEAGRRDIAVVWEDGRGLQVASSAKFEQARFVEADSGAIPLGDSAGRVRLIEPSISASADRKHAPR